MLYLPNSTSWVSGCRDARHRPLDKGLATMADAAPDEDDLRGIDGPGDTARGRGAHAEAP